MMAIHLAILTPTNHHGSIEPLCAGVVLFLRLLITVFRYE